MPAPIPGASAGGPCHGVRARASASRPSTSGPTYQVPLLTARLFVGVLSLMACKRLTSDSGLPGNSGAPSAPLSAATATGDRSPQAAVSGLPTAVPSAFPAPHGPRAYVSNEGSGDISVIDLETKNVVAVITIGKRPRGIQRSPDGRTIFVALSGSPAAGPNVKGPLPPPDKSADGIGVVDATSGKLTGKLPSGSDPEQFSLNASGTKLYISNEDTASLSIVDIVSKQIDQTISIAEEPEGVATSPDGKWVYVTCESASTVEVLDVGTHTVKTKIKVDGRPRSVAFLPDSSKAYATSELGGTVAIVSLPRHELVKSLKIDGANIRPMGVAISPNGKTAYVTTGHGGTVAVIDTLRDEVTGSIAVGKRPWGIATSPDGATLYTANGMSDDVSVIDPRTAQETGRIKVGSKPWGIVVVP